MTERRLEQLALQRLRIEQFGGRRDLTLDLAHPGLVVVHGPNESGKTTLATLLTWLLVGPTGSAADALRFGRYGDRIGGRLDAQLGDRPVQVEAMFSLLKKGLPNTRDMAIQLGGAPIDLDDWRTRLGGVDGTVFEATYRMWGATLHDAEEILTEIAQAALAGLTGSRRVNEVGDELHDEYQALVSSRARGTESWRHLTSEAEKITEGIQRIRAEADQYRHIRDRRDELANLIDATQGEVERLRGQVATLQLVSSVSAERQTIAEIDHRLAGLDAVPDVWRPVIADVDALEAAIDRVEASRQALRDLDDRVRRAVAALGLDDPPDGLRITHELSTQIAVASTELRSLEDRRRQALETRSDATGRAHDAERVARAERAECPELGDRPLDELHIDAAQATALRRSIEEWRTAERDAARADEAEGAQRLSVDQAVETARVAAEAWDRFGTGVTAQQWHTAPPPPTPRAMPGWVSLAAAGLAVAVGIVLVIAAPRWVGVLGLAGAAAVTAGAMLRRPTAASPSTSPHANVDPANVDPANADPANADPANVDPVAAAAMRVMTAYDALDTQRRELARLEPIRTHAHAQVSEHQQRTENALAQLGIMTTLTTADAADGLLDRIEHARSAHAHLADVQQRLGEADAAVTTLDQQIDEQRRHIEHALASAGVPAQLMGTAADQIDRLRELTELTTDHELAAQACEERAGELATMLEPLGADRHHEQPRLDLAAARHWESIHHERTQLIATRDTAAGTIAARLGQDEVARELIAADVGETELQARLSTADAALSEARRELTDQIHEQGQLAEQMRSVEDTDALAAARLTLGELEERADEQLWQGAVRLAARSLLGRLAAERRRTHQPALVERAGELLTSVADRWATLLVDPGDSGTAELSLLDRSGTEVPLHQLSTGARALTLLALRLATAELDAERRGVRMPLVCDDPLVHLDDHRAAAVVPLLARAAADGHQVLVFTCHRRTVEAAREVGAHVVEMPAVT